MSLLLAVFGPLAGSIGALMMMSCGVYWNYVHFFLNHQHVGISYPLITCIAILMFTSIFNAVREQKNKRFIQRAFSHYVSKDVVQELILNPRALSLKGEEKELTVLFSDIRGFTAFSETMRSQELGRFMNDYLTRMSRIIMDHHGTLDKFIGDAIMAFWGAPKDDLDHARHAVQAALKMKEELDRINHAGSEKGLPEIGIGIGINSGTVSVGNFGSNERFDYTVMGDNVNLASRLEGANKNYGTTILISESTHGQVKDLFFHRYIDKVQVKGRQQAIDIFEPLLADSEPFSLKDQVSRFEQGVAAFQNADFKQAKDIMDVLFREAPCRLYESYISRIDAFTGKN